MRRRPDARSNFIAVLPEPAGRVAWQARVEGVSLWTRMVVDRPRERLRSVSRSETAAPRVRGAAAVYIGMGLVQRAIGFVLIPFLTVVLTPTQYGQIATLTAVTALFTIVLGLGLETVVFRAAVAGSGSRASRGPRSQAVPIYLRFAVPVVGLLLAATVWGTGLRLAEAPPYALASAVAAAALTTPLATHGLPTLRGQNRLAAFVALSGISIVAQVGLMIGMVVVAGYGLAGWSLAVVVGAGVGHAASFLLLPPPRLSGGGGGALRDSLAFSLPLLPHQLSTWVTAFVDRLIMVAMLSPAVVGIYSLSYQAATVLGLVLLELNRAFMPHYVRLADPPARAPLAELVRLHVSAMLVLTTVALVSTPVLGIVLFRGDFVDAIGYLGPLLMAHLLYGCYFIPANVITLARGRSRLMWVASGAGAAVNVVLNLVLLGSWGAWGAVIATVAAYAVMAIVAGRIEASYGGELMAVASSRAVLAGLVCLAVMTVASLAPLVGRGAFTALSYVGCVLVVGVWPARHLLRHGRRAMGAAPPVDGPHTADRGTG